MASEDRIHYPGGRFSRYTYVVSYDISILSTDISKCTSRGSDAASEELWLFLPSALEVQQAIPVLGGDDNEWLMHPLAIHVDSQDYASFHHVVINPYEFDQPQTPQYFTKYRLLSNVQSEDKSRLSLTTCIPDYNLTDFFHHRACGAHPDVCYGKMANEHGAWVVSLPPTSLNDSYQWIPLNLSAIPAFAPSTGFLMGHARVVFDFAAGQVFSFSGGDSESQPGSPIQCWRLGFFDRRRSWTILDCISKSPPKKKKRILKAGMRGLVI